MVWDECAMRATGETYYELAERPLHTLSGGEQKKLSMEALLRGEADVLLLDEPDNFLDIPGKRWLEGELRRTNKTLLFVSHDRELLAATASRIVTVEAAARGRTGARSPRTTAPVRLATSASNVTWRCTSASASGWRRSSR